MSDDPSALSLAKFEDLADALAFALRFQGRKRVHNADETHVGDRRQAPGRAFGAIGIRRHEEAADRRGSCARPWSWGPMMLRWLRRRQDAPWLAQADAEALRERAQERL